MPTIPWRVLLLLGVLSACTAPPPPEDMSKGPDPAVWFPADHDASRRRFRGDCTKLVASVRDFEITDSAATPGFFATYGDVIDFVPNLSSRPGSFLAVTMEYGTMGLDPINEPRSANRMILDGEKYNFRCVSQEVCDTIDTNTREMFNPSDPVWRHKVLREADLVFRTLRDRF
jgi:hypothetical protein